MRNSVANRPESPASGLEPLPRQSSDINGRQAAGVSDAGKDKRYVHPSTVQLDVTAGAAGRSSSLRPGVLVMTFALLVSQCGDANQ